jgi:hypothetical protein
MTTRKLIKTDKLVTNALSAFTNVLQTLDIALADYHSVQLEADADRIAATARRDAAAEGAERVRKVRENVEKLVP